MPNKYSSSIWDKALSEKGYRLTKPREAILHVLEKAQEVLTAEAIYMTVHKVYPNIGLTTVYRNLEFLVNAKVVAKFNFGFGHARYELTEEFHPLGHHHHLVCLKCSKVFNYTNFSEEEVCFLTKSAERLQKESKFRIQRHVLHYFGECNKCQKNKSVRE